MNIKLNGELYDFICIHGEKRGAVYILEYVSGDTLVANSKTHETFLTIKQSLVGSTNPYIVDCDLYSYIIENCTYYEDNLWELLLKAFYKGEQVLLTACNGVVFITSI